MVSEWQDISIWDGLGVVGNTRLTTQVQTAIEDHHCWCVSIHYLRFDLFYGFWLDLELLDGVVGEDVESSVAVGMQVDVLELSGYGYCLDIDIDIAKPTI